MGFLERIPDRLRNHLDDFNFWIGIAYFGLVLVVIALFFLNERTAHTEAKAAAERAAIASRLLSEAEATYQGCVSSIPQLRRISQHISGVNEGFDTMVANARALVESTPKSDPQYPVRLANLLRISSAQQDVAAIRELHVPTVKECAARRVAILRS